MGTAYFKEDKSGADTKSIFATDRLICFPSSYKSSDFFCPNPNPLKLNIWLEYSWLSRPIIIVHRTIAAAQKWKEPAAVTTMGHRYHVMPKTYKNLLFFFVDFDPGQALRRLASSGGRGWPDPASRSAAVGRKENSLALLAAASTTEEEDDRKKERCCIIATGCSEENAKARLTAATARATYKPAVAVAGCCSTSPWSSYTGLFLQDHLLIRR